MKLDRLKGRGSEYLYRHPKYKTFYFRRFTKETGEVTQSLRTTDLNEAKAKRDEILRGVQKPVRQRLTALELFDVWLDRQRHSGKAKATVVSIVGTRSKLAPFFEHMMPDEIGVDWWTKEFQPAMRAVQKESFRFFNLWKWLNSFLRYLHDEGHIKKLPRLKNPDPKGTPGRALSDEEVGDLLNFAQNEDLRLAILMASTMGMRRGEIFALRASDVDIKDNSIHLEAERTKTRKGRQFAISPATLPIIRQRALAGSPWIFPSKADPTKPLHKDGFKTAWNNLRKITGVRCRFHDLRHTFLTKAFAAPGANPALICNYAGLSLEVAERVYLHLTKKDSAKIAGLVSYDV